MTKKIARLAPTHWELLLGLTESPIEQSFLSSFCEISFYNGFDIGKTAICGSIEITPQRRVGPYWIDFEIFYKLFRSKLLIAVECDGHEFYEKTKKQAAHDRVRDRALVATGYRVMHFTGSEIHVDARGCAAEVFNIIMDFQTTCVEEAGRAFV